MVREVARTDSNAVFVTPPFDTELTVTDRALALILLSEDAARRMMEREEAENPGVPFPWLPTDWSLRGDDDSFVVDPAMARRQEEKRRTYQVLVGLETAIHRAQTEWEITNEAEPWLDENGEHVTLAAVIESMLPGEDLRNSSGRARQKAAFPQAAKEMQDVGVPLQDIVRCADTGKSSVLGIVSSAQKKLKATEPDKDELKERYLELIELASAEQTLDDLEEKVDLLVNPTMLPKPKIHYTVTPGDGETMWVVMRIDDPGLRRLFFKRLGDVLETASSTVLEGFRRILKL